MECRSASCGIVVERRRRLRQIFAYSFVEAGYLSFPSTWRRSSLRLRLQKMSLTLDKSPKVYTYMLWGREGDVGLLN